VGFPPLPWERFGMPLDAFLVPVTLFRVSLGSMGALGVAFWCLVTLCRMPLGFLWVPLDPFGVPLGSLGGSLGVPVAPLGLPLGCLGGPLAPSGHPSGATWLKEPKTGPAIKLETADCIIITI
jgi:hypothetical protein